MYNLGGNAHYVPRNFCRNSNDQQVMIFYDTASYETKECNMESPFYFEVSEQDMFLSEQTALSLQHLYESVRADSEIRDYLQVVAASCDRFMLLQQQNVNEFYEMKKKQMEMSGNTPTPMDIQC